MKKVIEFIRQVLGEFQIPFGAIDQPQAPYRATDHVEADFYKATKDHSQPPKRR